MLKGEFLSMLVEGVDKNVCTGCAACYNSCPQNCIKMLQDEMGFLYPNIDETKCKHCGLCTKICPIINKVENKNNTYPDVYAAWSNSEEIRYKSTSGGAFSELATYVLERGGIVAGAEYNQDNLVVHTLIDSIEGLEKIRQSKYVQSDIKDTYKQIKQQLLTGRSVAFCGAACQVAGLYSYLGSKPDNLITFDFICRGMNSPKAYKFWLEEIEEKYKAKVTRVWFKYKKNGWKQSPRCTRIDFDNGTTCILEGENNTFMVGYLDLNLYIRTSCGDCHFKGTPRIADITLADFWGISSDLDDNKGTSLIMANNEKGQKFIELASSRMNICKRNYEEISGGNVCAEKSVEINPKSSEFLISLGSKPFSKLLKKYMGITIVSRIKKKIKKLLKAL